MVEESAMQSMLKVKPLHSTLVHVVPSVTKLVSVEADRAPFTPFPLSVLFFNDI